MYPLHKFVPLPFGTYMMYIEDERKKVNVRTAPEDLHAFKADLAKIKVKKLDQPKYYRKDTADDFRRQQPSSKVTSKKDTTTEKVVEPSYQMRFLRHEGQVVTGKSKCDLGGKCSLTAMFRSDTMLPWSRRYSSQSRLGMLAASSFERKPRADKKLHSITSLEQPPNVTVIDTVTGADVTSTAPWMKNRPRRWNEILKHREIEIPQSLGSFLPQSKNQAVKKPFQQAGERLLENERNKRSIGPVQRKVAMPTKSTSDDRLKQSMQPHLYKQVQHSRETERRNAREQAARKRKRRVDKVMTLVSNRARESARKSSNTSDQTLITTAGTKTGQRLSGNVFQSIPPSSGSKFHLQPLLEEAPESMEWRKSNKEMLVPNDDIPMKAKDWNPRAEQAYMNHVILERLENAVPYQWKSKKHSETSVMAGGHMYAL